MSTEDTVRQLDQRWADAEQRGDTDTLAALTTDDFVLVGPLGFVLNKQQWLDRYHTGDLVTKSLDWHDAEVRDYGGCAVVVGVHTQKAEYRGNPVDGEFRSTHIAIRRDNQWLLAGIQLSPVGAPPAFTRNPPAAQGKEVGKEAG
jgi:ketosteroid isomerase-like protein